MTNVCSISPTHQATRMSKTPPPKGRNIHHSTSSSKNVSSGKCVIGGTVFSSLSLVLESLKIMETFSNENLAGDINFVENKIGFTSKSNLNYC